MKIKRNKKSTTSIMVSIFIIAMFLPLVQSHIETPSSAPAWDNLNWWNTQWPYRKLLTIDHTKVSEDLSNFPVLFSEATDPDLAANAQPTGFDIVFVSYDDNTTALSHEIEFYDPATGQLVVWINTPLLRSTVDTKLWLYYGNPSCGDQQQIEATWDASYLAVHHLEETTGTVFDSTVYTNDGTPAGNLNQDVTGKINGADYFDGVDDQILLPSVYTTENSFTIETWIYAEPGARHFISQRSDTQQGIFLQVTSDNSLQYYINSFSHITGLALNTWYYVALAYNGTTASLYLNNFDSAVACSPPTWPAVPMCLGNRPAGDRAFHGTMDEVRLSTIARSSGWITTTYTNQNDPASFLSVSAEEPYEYTLTLTTDPAQGGSIQTVPLPPYYYNDLVTLTAVPSVGYLFDYWTGDLTGNQNPASITMDTDKSVTAVFLLENQNQPPVAEDDIASVLENSTDNTIDVLANDSDPDGDTLTIESVTQPTHGTSTHDGAYAYYTPDTGYVGADVFTYKITDGNGGAASATVYLTVLPSQTNHPPYPPSQPVPDDKETNVSVTTDLWWTGGDPDEDPVRYDVYFGTTSTPPLVSSNQSSSTYNPGILAYDTTYYWRIVSWDSHNATTQGPLWSFTTLKQESPGSISVTITKPLENSFYLRNIRLLRLPSTTIVYGPLTITADVTVSNTSVDRVEFYVDGKLKRVDDAAPYSYRWAPLRCFKHDLMVKAYATNGMTASDEITVFKWRLHPLLIAAGWILITTH